MGNNSEKFVISDHAMKRYAERVMKREDRCSVEKLLSERSDYVRESIVKMVTYGDLVYSGKSLVDSKSTENIDIYVSGLWVILVASKSKTVITLFKINLGAGEEIDKKFMIGIREIIEEKKNNLEKNRDDARKKIAAIELEIEGMKIEMAENNAKNKMLEDKIGAKRSEIVAINHDLEFMEMSLRDSMMPLVGRRNF